MVWVERVLIAIANAALIAIMLIMTVDAVGRYLLTSPLTAAFELIQILMAVLIFSAMPIVTLRREHVVVDLFDSVIPGRARVVVGGLVSLACVLISMGYAWVLWKRGAYLAAGNEITANLEIQMGPVAYGMSAAWALCAIAFVVAALKSPKKDREDGDTSGLTDGA